MEFRPVVRSAAVAIIMTLPNPTRKINILESPCYIAHVLNNNVTVRGTLMIRKRRNEKNESTNFRPWKQKKLSVLGKRERTA